VVKGAKALRAFFIKNEAALILIIAAFISAGRQEKADI
jgi:hypothetical protein